MNKKKTKEDKYDSQFNDYRDNDEEERTEHINKGLNKTTNTQKITKFKSE